MMRHITEVTHSRFFKDGPMEAIVFGKGKSFDPEAVKKVPGAVVVSINDAVNMLGSVDICVMNDLNVIERLNMKSISKTRFFFVPASIPRRDRHNPEIRSYQCSDFWIKNSYNLSLMNGKTYYFDANFCEFDFFDGPIYCAYHSTYETVLHMLGAAGIKKVYTSGIDYDSNYHGDFLKEHPNDFSAMRPHVEQIKRQHGIEEIRL